MNNIFNCLDELFPNPKGELNYNNDFELLIAVVLSAQTTDKKVNAVTNILFSKYNLYTLKDASKSDLEDILKPLGMSKKKSQYIKDISKTISEEYDGKIPGNKKDLLKISGVGNKTANLVLATLYNKPYLAVDTHVERVSKRLGLVDEKSNVLDIERKLYKIIPKDRIIRTHHQLVLFGRYYCKSINPKCETCKLRSICKKNQI
jgi:endonuclease-3